MTSTCSLEGIVSVTDLSKPQHVALVRRLLEGNNVLNEQLEDQLFTGNGWTTSPQYISASAPSNHFLPYSA